MLWLGSFSPAHNGPLSSRYGMYEHSYPSRGLAEFYEKTLNWTDSQVCGFLTSISHGLRKMAQDLPS